MLIFEICDEINACAESVYINERKEGRMQGEKEKKKGERGKEREKNSRNEIVSERRSSQLKCNILFKSSLNG